MKDPKQVHNIVRICWKNILTLMVFNNDYIPEADGFTPEMLEDTYVDAEILLLIYGEVPEFSKATKCLWYAICSAHENPM